MNCLCLFGRLLQPTSDSRTLLVFVCVYGCVPAIVYGRCVCVYVCILKCILCCAYLLYVPALYSQCSDQLERLILLLYYIY